MVKLPPEIYQLTQLKRISLRQNALSWIPPEIGKLVNLEYLDLSFNEIEEIPTQLSELVKLQELYLNHNSISYLPITLAKLQPTLRILTINDNVLLKDPPAEIIEKGTDAILNELKKKL